MAGRISKADWDKILAALDADPVRFGIPEGGREGSLVLASFNIRKLGKAKNRERELEFMARFCAACDLVAIQEVQDDLTGLRYLKDRVEARIAAAGEYALSVSDITGKVPGDDGMAERLAFLHRSRRIRRLELASDLTYDRTSVVQSVLDQTDAWDAAREVYEKRLAEHAAGTRKTKPTFVPPEFVSFVRTPYVVGFEAPAANDMAPLTFTAVNAHLVYGTPVQRRQEFDALLSWLIRRLESEDRLVAPNFVLLGDLNLDFDKPVADRKRIDAAIRKLNQIAFGDPDIRRVYFPFLDKHPRLAKVLKTNARANQTFDQIGFFNGRKETRLPNDLWRDDIKENGPDGFDFGVFDFADLFSRVLLGKPYASLSKADRKSFGKKYENSVSDHLPIWVRIPRPGFSSSTS
tara:strand:- start:24471 stop:25688 length:1218 start_codon:yes stop_codon:yes gene_type:complete